MGLADVYIVPASRRTACAVGCHVKLVQPVKLRGVVCCKGVRLSVLESTAARKTCYIDPAATPSPQALTARRGENSSPPLSGPWCGRAVKQVASNRSPPFDPPPPPPPSFSSPSTENRTGTWLSKRDESTATLIVCYLCVWDTLVKSPPVQRRLELTATAVTRSRTHLHSDIRARTHSCAHALTRI